MILVFMLFCDSSKTGIRLNHGLVGAYYGNADFTNVKQAEVLSGLDMTWDEETGHGSSWSGQWQGMLIAPVSDTVTLYLSTNKNAFVELGETDKMMAKTDSGEVILTLVMIKGYSYPLKVGYGHLGGGEGYLRLKWSWRQQKLMIIPKASFYFTKEQALSWNYIVEPDPDTIDYLKFFKPEAEHFIVHYQSGRFCGWPANNGIWSWDDEILVGFTFAYYQEKELHHSIDQKKPSKSVLARSVDGGKSWVIEDPDNYVGDGGKLEKLGEKINFAHPDFTMRCNGNQFYYSYDRGKSWDGPFEFEKIVENTLTSRTDYVVNNEDDCHIFLSAKNEQVQARLQDRTICARTVDGGQTIEFLSWIGEPIEVRAVMPSTVRIDENHLITALRRRFDRTYENKPPLPENWIDVYESLDNVKSWQFLSKVADTDMGKHNGNPPCLIKLKDGRLAVTYAFRAQPYGIRARLSDDKGKSWSEELHLRDDGRTYDIGYTRSVQRTDGKIVTIYYYTTEKNKEQHIAVTIWDPNKISTGRN
jgi:hypothetical protein